MEFIQRNKSLMAIGAVAGLLVIGKIANDRNGWWTNMFKKEDDKSEDVVVPVAEVHEPRGKLQRSFTDVNMWDDQNRTFCPACEKFCNQSYSDKSSTQCEQCLANC